MIGAGRKKRLAKDNAGGGSENRHYLRPLLLPPFQPCAIFFPVPRPPVHARLMNAGGSRGRALLTAAAVSLLVHATLFGGWQLGKKYGWWRDAQLPAFFKFFLPAPPSELAAAPKPEPTPKISEVPLVFVDVDPSRAALEPPKETPYYGAANSVAANPNPTIDLNKPNVDGRESPVVKVTPSGRPLPLPLQPTPVPKQESDSTTETDAQPEKKSEKLAPGDLAMAKPNEEARPGKPNEIEQPAKESKKPKPRKISEVKQNSMQSEPSKMPGGVRLEGISSLNVKGSIFGNYDREFVNAVETEWRRQIDKIGTVPTPGRVVLEFRLHADGSVSHMKVVESTVGEILEIICQLAVTKPAKYPPWPDEWRRLLDTDFRDVRFTFYYSSG